jgi:hypothetical protein
MKTHLFLAAAVGSAITVTTSHAALGRSLEETIQQTADPPKDRKRSIRRVNQGGGNLVQLDGIEYTISTNGIVENCFDGKAQVLWDV